ncbi:helicase associated domain-containing protein [Curtobacterium sp. 9128]|uniref:helicase associated domain-containing protein n=1 Tax=Curtobacterium sp. 9128 TaxID=1793722 RepID=UPI00119D256D|nr:helicase associated domain-containing protein [Curtobacterium sp. 9128]
MSTPTAALGALWSEYAALSDQPSRLLSLEQRRGVEYYLADIAPDAASRPFVRRWIDRVHELESFVIATGRMPLADRRRPRPATTEQSLVDAVAYFRQVHAAGGYCDYQVRRIEAVPGFAWSPRDARWETMLAVHQQFWAEHGFAPRRRSSDPAEVAIGRWVAQQRALHSRGQLQPARAARLRHAAYRVL